MGSPFNFQRLFCTCLAVQSSRMKLFGVTEKIISSSLIVEKIEKWSCDQNGCHDLNFIRNNIILDGCTHK